MSSQLVAAGDTLADRYPGMTPEDAATALANDLGELAEDPLEFVYWAFAWGEGQLAHFDGPDPAWQVPFLRELGQEIRLRGFDGITPVAPVLFSTVSGHGTGKSALTGMVADFIKNTRPMSKGVFTANTANQLRTKTWAEVTKWSKLSICAPHWKHGTRAIEHVMHGENWRQDAIAWKEGEPEAFAGLHAATSSAYFMMDEASKMPRIIVETAFGGMTDGEPMMFLFGNGTRNSGYFYETHHKLKHQWKRFQVDSRKAARTNKDELDKWIEEHGLDSDFARIRILGQFPKQSSEQFIASDIVAAARIRHAEPLMHDPIIIGVDVARFGDDRTIIKIRQGRDARSTPPIILSKADTMQVAAKVAELARRLLPDGIIVDGGGVGGGVVDRLRQLNIPNVFEVNFGAKSPDRKCHDMGAYMWWRMREAIKDGLAIDDDDDLAQELTTREYFFDVNNAVQLESKADLKKRGEVSPDHADGLALTYAYDFGPRDTNRVLAALRGGGTDTNVHGVDYDPHQ